MICTGSVHIYTYTCILEVFTYIYKYIICVYTYGDVRKHGWGISKGLGFHYTDDEGFQGASSKAFRSQRVCAWTLECSLKQ